MENKFNIGDKVRCINPKFINRRLTPGIGWKLDREFIIDRFHSTCNVAFPKNGHGVWIEYLELVSDIDPIQEEKLLTNIL